MDRWRRYFLWTTALPTHVVVGAATLGPLGKIGKAPGTIGSVAGVGLYAAVFSSLYPVGYLLLLAVLCYLAIGLCGEAENRLHMRDPGMIILDECVAVPLVFLGPPGWTADYGGWPVLLAGFLLFRLFDIAKPLWINRLQNYPGGFGVVLDDLGAALVSCLILHLGCNLIGSVSEPAAAGGLRSTQSNP